MITSTMIDLAALLPQTQLQAINVLADGLIDVTNSEYDEVIVRSIRPTEQQLEDIIRIAKGNSKVSFEDCFLDENDAQNFCLDLQLVGFINPSIVRNHGSEVLVIVCHKPSWEPTESAKIAIPSVLKGKWKMDSTDLAEDDLVDENDLLNDGIVAFGAECGVDKSGTSTKKRACKDCSCGFAQELLTASTSAAPVRSSCGSCYKGDAFRCASCPFLGQPAFQADTHRVVLSAGTDDF